MNQLVSSYAPVKLATLMHMGIIVLMKLSFFFVIILFGDELVFGMSGRDQEQFSKCWLSQFMVCFL